MNLYQPTIRATDKQRVTHTYTMPPPHTHAHMHKHTHVHTRTQCTPVYRNLLIINQDSMKLHTNYAFHDRGQPSTMDVAQSPRLVNLNLFVGKQNLPLPKVTLAQ